MQTSSETGEEPVPTSGTDDHVSNLEAFFKELNLAAKSVLARSPRRYGGAYVLLLRWEEDDLGTETEVTDLEKVFRNVYHYTTERYLIPSKDPTTQLEYRLNDFRRAYNNGTNLLILYYGGHGALDLMQRPSKSIWAAKEVGGPRLVWSELQGILERAKSDVVFILDCCFAATATRYAGSKEGLWACNSEVTTTGVNDNSFTRNLIAELESLSTSRFNIAILHAKLMGRYLQPGPHMLETEPWYTYLGERIVPSVELIPQPHDGSDNLSAVATLTVETSMTETLVLLAVRLKDKSRVPKLSSWKEWCHSNAPDDVESVHGLGSLQIRDLVMFEAYYYSHSALLLVSMPLFLWDRLPRSPCYSFIGYIESSNLLFSSVDTQQTKTQLYSKTYSKEQGWVQNGAQLQDPPPDYESIFSRKQDEAWKKTGDHYWQMIGIERHGLAQNPLTLAI